MSEVVEKMYEEVDCEISQENQWLEFEIALSQGDREEAKKIMVETDDLGYRGAAEVMYNILFKESSYE